LCSSKEIIYAGHYAFGYLTKRYGLEYFAAQGVSPDSEPTAADLINLVNQIKKDNIKYIFYEELSSPKIAQTLSDETGAELLLLNAAHNISKEQLEQGATFISIMKNNLTNLKIGLGYKE
jgi:zinc transport system substrate-binding protein